MRQSQTRKTLTIGSEFKKQVRNHCVEINDKEGISFNLEDEETEDVKDPFVSIRIRSHSSSSSSDNDWIQSDKY